jgi:hypothetical protein
MAPPQIKLELSVILQVVKEIYSFLRPWLYEQAKNTTTPIDDWMLHVLDSILGITDPAPGTPT